ncbi:MAG TPA: hypothetical protein VKT73_15145 [Xanthobacteraceae bacterium]|nr:hypothetical protein [Xanthobacteraceae bacterium]
MSGAGFIPEIWSGKLIEKFYASTVLTAISNTDYEGEIKNQGDKVRIRTKPTVTIKDYKADGALELERPVGSEVDLLIDKGKYFNTILDDVMDVQSDLNQLSMWSDDAAEQMKITIDKDVLLGILNQANAANQGLTAGAISGNINLGVTGTPLAAVSVAASSKVDILSILLRLGQALDEKNIPETGRWVILPAWAAVLVKNSELRQAYLSGDSVSILRNGRLGMVDRFTLYISNLLPSGTAAGLASGEWPIYAGHAHGLTFASQVSKVETLRSEMTFGTVLRGLQVYGYKVLDGTALAQAIVTPG